MTRYYTNDSRDHQRDEFDAEVIAAFGRHLLVRDGDARELRARPAGRRLSIVCGDRVRCEPDRAHDEVLIVEVLPRTTLLARANLRGESEPVVANITQLVVVVAPLPAAGLLHRRSLPVRGHRGGNRRRGRGQQVRSRG